MANEIQSGKSVSHDDGMLMNEMPCGMTIGQVLGNRVSRQIITEAHRAERKARILDIEEIEMAYSLAEGASSIVLKAVKKLHGKGLFYDDLADFLSEEIIEADGAM